MNCPKCQTPNRASANFCKACGALLVQNCPRCKFELPDEAVFCDNCGLRLVMSDEYWWLDAQAQSASPSPVPPGKPSAPPLVAPPPPAVTSPPAARSAATPSDRAQSARPAPASADSQLQRFIPQGLLDKLEAARNRGEMVGERRIVTMLFCDMKGSTAAAEGLDPEDWTEIINGAFEHMIKPVYRYEGTVARLMGDAILAFFGAPIAHEDDPQRAVLAGLDIVAGIKPYRQQIQKRYGIDIDVRVGINTGLVVVGAVGSDLRLEYSATGDAINLAARMEQTATPGTVQIAQDTYKLVNTLFDFEDLGEIEVKGKDERVSAYRVLRLKAQTIRQRGIEGLHAEMVGREVELEALRGVITDLKQGVGRIVCVLGEAGLGKTRLVSEAHQIFNDLSGLTGNWYETVSLSYESNQAYGLFQRLIFRVMEIAHEDPPAVIRQKLAALIESLAGEQAVPGAAGPDGGGPPTDTRRQTARQVFEALFGLESEDGGLPLEGETFKHELFEAMRQWWRVSFSTRPTVLVFDDMHWSDTASIELLLRLLPLTEEIPLVLLCALRSERGSPAWQIKTAADADFRHRYTELSLKPLSESESSELVSRLLAIADISDQLRARILEKSSGNPFFIEEVVRTLIDNGVVVSEQRSVNGTTKRYWRATSAGADFDIPDSLQSLLAARIDRLEEATRATLQMASVIGRSFFHRVLLAVDEASQELDKHLGTLLRLDLIREAARVPELEYAFRNPLTQEAVYNTILLKRRRMFHQQVGEAIETLYPDRLEGFFGLLAHHFALAGQRDKAIEYSRQAARQAVAVFAYDDAIQNLQSALEWIQPGDQVGLHQALVEELADVYCLLRDGEQTIALYQQALDLWKGLPGGEPVVELRLHRKLLQFATEVKWTVDLEHYQQSLQSASVSRLSLERILDSLASEPPHPERVSALAVLSFDAWRNQMPPDWDRAQRFAQAAVAMAEQLADPLVLSQALGALGDVFDGRSLLREQLHVAQRRLEVVQESCASNPAYCIDALNEVGMALMYVGEYEQALPHLREAEALSNRVQSIGKEAAAIGLQGQCWYRLDRWDEVFATEEKWRDLERRYSRQRVGPT